MTDQLTACQKFIRDAAIPQRLVLSIFGFLAIVNAYTMRLCLNIVMPHLVADRNQTYANATDWNSNSSKAPSIIDAATPTKPAIRKRLKMLLSKETQKSIAPKNTAKVSFDWSENLQTIIVSSFHVGYVLSQIPGGQLSERFGGKWVLAVSILASAILTLLTPTAIHMGGATALILLRVIIGIAEGPIFPALSTLLAHWVPPSERGKLGVLVLSGSQVGVCFANVCSSFLLQHFDWCWVFYFFGSCAIVWFGFFILLCYSDPDSHPFIGEKEKEYLMMVIRSTKSSVDLPPTPWRAILTSPPMWALIFATIQYDWGQYALVGRLTNMLKNIKDFSEQPIAYTVSNSLPYMLKWVVSLASGFLSDTLINREILSISSVRKIMTSIAAFGPHLFAGMRDCICEHNEVMPLINCGIGVMGAYYAGIKLTTLDMSPNYAGTLMGIANGVGSITGVIIPYLEDAIPSSILIREFRALVWVAVTAFTTGEVQPFNDPPSEQSDKNK